MSIMQKWKNYIWIILVFCFVVESYIFPDLLIGDCIHAVVSETEKMRTEKEYEELFDVSEDEYKICFRFLR